MKTYTIVFKSDSRVPISIQADRIKFDAGFALFILDEKEVSGIVNCETVQSITCAPAPTDPKHE